MIPRLSGRDSGLSAAADPAKPEQKLPSKQEAEKIIRQFFNLIERFSVPDEAYAPEMKASLRRKTKGKVRLSSKKQGGNA